MEKKLVVVVDFQVDFLNLKGSKLPVPGSKELIGPMTEYLLALRAENTVGVLFTQDSHSPEHVEYMPDGTAFPSHCVIGTQGHGVAFNTELIDLGIMVYGLQKNEFDMFAEEKLSVYHQNLTTDRGAFFAQIKQAGVTDVEVVGVATDICVNFTVLGLIKLGFNVTVRSDLVKGLFRQSEEMANEWPGVNIR